MLYHLRVDLEVDATDGDDAIEQLKQALIGSPITIEDVLDASAE